MLKILFQKLKRILDKFILLMTFSFNGTTIDNTNGTVTYNGTELDRLQLNGVTVWEKITEQEIQNLTWTHMNTSAPTTFVNGIYTNNDTSTQNWLAPSISSTFGTINNLKSLSFEATIRMQDKTTHGKEFYIGFYENQTISWWIFNISSGIGYGSSNIFYQISESDIYDKIQNNIWYTYKFTVYPDEKAIQLKVYETISKNVIYSLSKYTDSTLQQNFPTWLKNSNTTARIALYGQQSQDENLCKVFYTQN